MGLLQNLADKFREEKQELDEQDDDVTKDKVLRTLRRQRRKQMEELEKAQLKKEIDEYNKEHMAKYAWGMGDDDKLVRAIKKKKLSLLKDGGNDVLKQKSMMTKQAILKKKCLLKQKNCFNGKNTLLK